MSSSRIRRPLILCLLLIAAMASKIVASTVFRVVYVTVPNKEVALNISKSVVEGKLAACVNIVPGVTSVYEWEDKVHVDDELLLIIKTQESRLAALHDAVTKIHPYEVPEFISLPVDHASEKYGQWVQKQTSLPTNEEM